MIVGGGIGGLALATHLARQGIEVVLVEKAPQRRTMGFIVGLFPNGVHHLRLLGLGDAIQAVATVVPLLEVLGADNRILARYDLGRLAPPSTLVVERECLLEGLARTCPVPVRYSTTVEALRQRTDHVLVRLSDGSEECVDLVVGADGTASTTRQYVTRKPPARSAGFAYSICWLTEGVTEGATNILGHGGMIGLYPTRSGRVGALFLHRQGGSNTQACLRTTFSGLSARVDQILEQIPPNEQFLSRREREFVVRRWRRGRVVLLGDAAHTLSPVLGLGASLALEDAWQLAQAVTCSDPLEQRLASYERHRDRRARSALRASWLVHLAASVTGSRLVQRPWSWLLRSVVLPGYFAWLSRFVSAHSSSFESP